MEKTSAFIYELERRQISFLFQSLLVNLIGLKIPDNGNEVDQS